ncbi:hypothetical protein KDL01_38180 [Actinospica durhamensis]|uniref:Transglycosylase SLT domain-containing protein n=1 Tax=Actinospica durhamensis TaxID=1508375 RepID=A0A941F0H2_9ACTN|nr:hypothetical protein [Actinospica durhamensis]MBR7839154.1 hypothetical protein [Actinospica durhamensis]
MGSHSKSKHGRQSPITRSDANNSWMRKYPAITVAALAGTVVGGPGGVAAAMALGDQPVSTTPNTATADLVPATAVTTPATTTSTTVAASSVKTSASASAKASATSTAHAVTPVVEKTNPYASVSWGTLEPVAFYGSQGTFTPSTDQWENAKTIVQVAENRGMPLYSAVIAVATAIQESRLINLTTATNADSLGLFQQRPSQGWGTTDQLTTPSYAANAFLAALQEDAPDYMGIYLWEAAQDVQRSGYPTAYAQWQSQATTMVFDIVNGKAPV